MVSEFPTIEHRDFVFFLVIHLIRSPLVLEKAGHVVEVTDFHRQGEERYQLLWAVAQEYWREHQRLITRQVLRMSVETRLNEDPVFLDEDAGAQLAADIEMIFDFSERLLVPRWILSQLQTFLHDRRLRGPAQAMSDALPEQLDQRLQELMSAHTTSQIASGRVVTSFQPGHMRLEQLPRQPTGTSFIDLLLGGGIRRGDVYGLMGPTGKGKTTMAVQLSWDAVEQGTDVAYFAYENPFEPEYTVRFYGYMAGIPFERIAGRSLHQLNPDDRERIREKLDRFGRRLHPVDMVGEGGMGVGCGGPPEVRAQLQEFQRKGQHIELAVIDQQLPQVDRYLAAHPSKLDRREMLQQSVDEYMKLGTELDVAFLLIHQVSPAEGTKPAYMKPDWSSAAECRSWAFWMTTCLAISNHDKNSLCWLISSKARGAPVQELILRMEGTRFRFVYEEERYRCQDRKFVDTFDQSYDGSGTRAVPTASAYRFEGGDVIAP